MKGYEWSCYMSSEKAFEQLEEKIAKLFGQQVEEP